MSNTGKDGNQHDNISDDDAIAPYCCLFLVKPCTWHP